MMRVGYAPMSIDGKPGQAARVAAISYTQFAYDPRVRREAGILADAGYEVDVYALAELARGVPLSSGVNLITVPLPRYRGDRADRYLRSYWTFLRRAGRQLLEAHRRRPYALVHCHTMPDLIVLAARPLRRAGVPVVLDIHDNMPEIFAEKFGLADHHWKIRLLLAAERFAATQADLVLTPTSTQAVRLASNRIPEGKIRLMHNLPDPGVFGACGAFLDRRSADCFRIVYHGTLARRLGLAVALEGLAGIRIEMDGMGPWRFEIYGGGDARAELIERTSALGLIDRVRFSEGFLPLDDLPAQLAGASLGLIPSLRLRDTDLMLPTKLLEYLYLGIPAITTATRTVREYVKPDEAILVESTEPAAWGRAVLSLRRSPDRAQAQARNAIGFFDRHPWEREAAGLREIVGRLIGRV